jgi:hypothetical protein
MKKISICYDKTKNNDDFLKDLISELKKQNTFYIIDFIFLEETEKEVKYTANVVLMNKRNRWKCTRICNKAVKAKNKKELKKRLENG